MPRLYPFMLWASRFTPHVNDYLMTGVRSVTVIASTLFILVPHALSISFIFSRHKVHEVWRWTSRRQHIKYWHWQNLHSVPNLDELLLRSSSKFWRSCCYTARQNSDAAAAQIVKILTQLPLRSASKIETSCRCAARQKFWRCCGCAARRILTQLLLRSASEFWRSCCCAAHQNSDAVAVQRIRILTQLQMRKASEFWRRCCAVH